MTIYTPSRAPQTYNLIKCRKYGWHLLNIYSFDINSNQCPWNEDIINSGISDEWKIYCNTEYSSISTFNGGKTCNGPCCGSIIDMMHEKNCFGHQIMMIIIMDIMETMEIMQIQIVMEIRRLTQILIILMVIVYLV